MKNLFFSYEENLLLCNEQKIYQNMKKNLKKVGFIKNCTQQEMLSQVLVGV